MTEKEYIEREAVLKDIEYFHHTSHIQSITRETEEAKRLWHGIHNGVNYCRNTVVNAPAADVVEVRRGEWIFLCAVSTMQYEAYKYRCSLCNEVEEMYKKKPFCPNCGADMRGDKGGRLRSSKD